MDKHLEIANELKQILCGQHDDWTGDSINDASAFLRELKRAYPGVANAMAGDLDRNIEDFVTMTELDHHTLLMAAKVLSGKAFSLDYMDDRRTPRTMVEAFGKSPASISGRTPSAKSTLASSFSRSACGARPSTYPDTKLL